MFMVDRFERFSLAISEIWRCWHRIAGEEMGKYGLKGPYAVYFTTLYRHPQGITASQLGDLCGRDKADVSRAVSLLESKGLIEKAALGKSTYRAPLKLTAQGASLAEVINTKACAAVELASKGLDPQKRAVLYEALELICNNLQTLSKNGLPEYDELERTQ